MVIGLNTQRKDTQIIDEDIANAGASPCGNQHPPPKEVANDDEAPTNFLAMTDVDIREDFLQMSQNNTTQEQSVTTQAQDMMAQANR